MCKSRYSTARGNVGRSEYGVGVGGSVCLPTPFGEANESVESTQQEDGRMLSRLVEDEEQRKGGRQKGRR